MTTRPYTPVPTLTSLLFALLLAAPASAQINVSVSDDGQAGQKPKPQPPAAARPATPPGPSIGFRAYANLDWVSMAAKDSFDAVLGTSTMSGAGGGGEVIRIWKGLFGRFGVSSMSDEGTRVAVVNGEVIPLDIPTEISLRTIELGGGWRHEIRPRPRVPSKVPPKTNPPPAKPTPPKPAPSTAKPPARPAQPPPPRFALYGGAAFLQVSYQETATFDEPGHGGRASLSGYSVFGGAEVTIWKWVFAGVEGQYRSIENGLGEGGVSEVFNETNLGGAAIRILFGVRR